MASQENCDRAGDLPIDKAGADLLFQVISLRVKAACRE
jgi:hypothetical protein